jgi:MFS family permease
MLAAGGCYFIGNAMQNMAASWLMVERSGSPAITALVQTAAFAPMFLFSLPAGVLADTIDRRRLMLRVQAVYGAAALLLAILELFGMLGPQGLLWLTFVLGSCVALQSPAWNSAAADTVDRRDIPQAVTLVSMAYNGARVLGPLLGGAVFAASGASAVFGLALLAALGMSYATWRWPPPPPAKSRLPAERLWGGTALALRYARHSPATTAQIVHTVAFSLIGSALWALLPVIAKQRLGLDAPGFGVLMACLGGGAIAAGLVLGELRARLGFATLAIASKVLFALAMLTAGLSVQLAVICVALVVGGMAWMALISTLNAATQTSVPTWIRARAMSMHNASSLGSFALGSVAWGALAEAAGLPASLCVAAACMVLSSALQKRFPLRMGTDSETTIANGNEPVRVAVEPEFEEGPVAVEVIYVVKPEDAGTFLKTVQPLADFRRRNGASFWRIYQDLGEPGRYVERFIVTSWGDYLRQRERETVAIQQLEVGARQYQVPGVPVVTRHYLAQQAAA